MKEKNKPYALDEVFIPCRSGKHFWYFEEDARMCCTGHKQVVVLDPDEADTWLYLFRYGYKWVKEDQDYEQERLG